MPEGNFAVIFRKIKGLVNNWHEKVFLHHYSFMSAFNLFTLIFITKPNMLNTSPHPQLLTLGYLRPQNFSSFFELIRFFLTALNCISRVLTSCLLASHLTLYPAPYYCPPEEQWAPQFTHHPERCGGGNDLSQEKEKKKGKDFSVRHT